MAWAQKLPSGLYAGRYRDAQEKKRTAPGGPWTHRAEALRMASEAEVAARRRHWRSPDAAKATWREWVEVWWPTRGVEGSTADRDRSRLEKHLLPRWGDVPLEQISRHDVKVWAQELRESGRVDRRTDATKARDAKREREWRGGLSAPTVTRIVSMLSASLRGAIDAEILEYNPAERIRVTGSAKTIDRYLTKEEFDLIVDFLDPDSAALVTILAYTGMRIGEVALRTPADVDMQRRRLYVSSVLDYKTGIVKPYTKNRHARYVPLAQRVLDVIDLSGEYLTTFEGEVWRYEAIKWRWPQAVSRAGVEPVRLHDLRHTCASWLIQGGVSLEEVGKILGHASAQTTMRYAHLAEKPSQAVWDALS